MLDQAIDHLTKDPVMKSIIEKVGLLEIGMPTQDLYASLNKSIVSQQLSLKAASTIFTRFENLLEGKFEPQNVLKYSIEELRSVGLSYQKAGYVHNIAREFHENPNLGTNAALMSDEDLITTLTQIKGVGVWTVQMILIFTLHRHNIYPYDDLIIRKGTIFHYGLEETDKKVKQKCFEVSETWAPYKSIASRYLWASKDMLKL